MAIQCNVCVFVRNSLQLCILVYLSMVSVESYLTVNEL